MPELSPFSWFLLVLGATGVGISKSGLAGVSLIHVIVFAQVFGAKASTGALLPLLIVGDCCAVWLIGREVDWRYVVRLLPPAFVGVVIGWSLLGRLDEATFKPLIGRIIIAALLWSTSQNVAAKHIHNNSPYKAICVGHGHPRRNHNDASQRSRPGDCTLSAGSFFTKTSSCSNSAWFFFVLNISKLPFSANLGFISAESLLIDLILAPCVVGGLIFGLMVVRRLPQKVFDTVLLAFTAIAAIRMIFI